MQPRSMAIEAEVEAITDKFAGSRMVEVRDGSRWLRGGWLGGV